MKISGNTKGFIILLFLISMIISIFGCANDHRFAGRESRITSEGRSVLTPTPEIDIGDLLNPGIEVEREHTFTGTFEGEGFRIWILEGWSESLTGELIPASSAGALTLMTETGIDTELEIYVFMRRLEHTYMAHIYDNDEVRDLKASLHSAGSFDGYVLSFNITQNYITQYTYEFITIDDETAYIIRYETVSEEEPDFDLHDVGIMVSTLEID